MRVSILTDDPGYAAYHEAHLAGKTVRVRLNGVERTKVLTADEKERFVLRRMTDGEGKLIFDREREMVKTEVLRGDVCILIE